MKRIQAIELLDYGWIPPSLRHAAMASLQVLIGDHAARLLPKIEEALVMSGEREVVDLCSGGSGPWPVLAPALRARGLLNRVTLTDLYPDADAFLQAERESLGVVHGQLESLDAGRVPKDLRGLRTLFNAFHHFPPELATRVLQATIDAGRPIAIFEVVSRELLLLLFILLFPVIMLFRVPFLPRLHWKWLLWTYPVPVLPLLMAFDGLASCLRLYSVAELQALVRNLRAPGYRWDIGRIRLGWLPVHFTYLVGYPPSSVGG